MNDFAVNTFESEPSSERPWIGFPQATKSIFKEILGSFCDNAIETELKSMATIAIFGEIIKIKFRQGTTI